MDKGGESEQNKWIDFLYFAYKKAKQFVTRETSFVESIEIMKFEESLDKNIHRLADLLTSDGLLDRVNEMKGYLYFFPKSFGPNKEPRVRPKVAFPFEYQILWAAVILRIGEWFDTNSQLKNVYSMRDEKVRKELEWMVPWSFNGRIKRITPKDGESLFESSYVQYNDRRLYESHQMALRKYHTYEREKVQELFKTNEIVYRAELDIQEFFPTLKKSHIRKMFEARFNKLEKINCFKKRYFDPGEISRIIDTLLNLEIEYPDKIDDDDPINEVLKEYYKKLSNGEEYQGKENISSTLIERLKETLPLDLIASNFLSNCVLNHYVDKPVTQREHNSDVVILRYTDDYLVLSSDKEKVKNIIKDIKTKLEGIDLVYSVEKTLPTTIKDIEERLESVKKDNNWNDKYYKEIAKWIGFQEIAEPHLSELLADKRVELETKLSMFGIKLEPEKVVKNDIIQQLSITKLSKTADIKLHALSDDELEKYIEEMMFFMQAKGNVGELKEETAKIFAAWRLNASHQEQTYRKHYKYNDVKDFFNILKEAIGKYPYKLGFYDIYILTLLRVIEHDASGYQKLEEFLLEIKDILTSSSIINDEDTKGKMSKSEKFVSSCFPTIRMRVLNLLISKWKRFDKEKRVQLRRILEKVFLNWYAKPKIQWHELYMLYSNFFIIRIRLPLDICGVKEDHPQFLKDIAEVYNDYFFLTDRESEKTDETVSVKNNIGIAINLLEKGLYWDKLEGRYVFNEVDEIIYEKIKRELIQQKQVTYDTLAFVKIAPEKMKNKEDWLGLMDSNINQVIKTTDKEFIFAVFDFLQLNIQLYFEKPKNYSGILDWVEVESNDNGENTFKKYVKDRFMSYGKIRGYFSLTDRSYTPLTKKNRGDNEEEWNIPVADWVFYCQTLPYHLEVSSKKQKVLHPLTEYEFVKLLKKVIENENIKEDGNIEWGNMSYFEVNSLFEFRRTPKQWIEFRENNNNETNGDNSKDTNDVEKRVDKKEILEENMKKPKEIVQLLFSLLTNRPWHTHVTKHFSMYKWNDLQSYFEMTYYPSTSAATLFVNYLNIHQDFYSRLYNMPKEELPYRDIYTKRKSTDIDSWIKTYIEKQRENQIYKTDNRKLELLEIDIDQLRG